MRISDWSSDVCSSDLDPEAILDQPAGRRIEHGVAARSGDTAAGDAPGRLDREAHLDFAAALRARRLPRIIAILDAPADQHRPGPAARAAARAARSRAIAAPAGDRNSKRLTYSH